MAVVGEPEFNYTPSSYIHYAKEPGSRTEKNSLSQMWDSFINFVISKNELNACFTIILLAYC